MSIATVCWHVQVLFLVRTTRKADLQLLDLMLRDQPLHYKYQIIDEEMAKPGVPGRWTWEKMYEGLEAGQLYFKIDDDVVYVKVSMDA